MLFRLEAEVMFLNGFMKGLAFNYRKNSALIHLDNFVFSAAMKECIFLPTQSGQPAQQEDDDFDDEEDNSNDGVPSYAKLGCSLIPTINQKLKSIAPEVEAKIMKQVGITFPNVWMHLDEVRDTDLLCTGIDIEQPRPRFDNQGLVLAT